MQIKTSMRHLPESSAMTQEDINTYLDKKFKFMRRSVNEDETVEFKIKKKNPRITEDCKFPKTVYEVRIMGKLKTGDDFFYVKESTDLKNAIDLLASTVKEDTSEKVKAKLEKPKGFRCVQKEVEI